MSVLPLTTPQMQCPTCRKVVRITGAGSIREHARSNYVFGRETRKRCPASGVFAPAGGHRRFLEELIEDRSAVLVSRRADEAAALRRLEELREGRVAAEAALAEATAALEEVSK